MVLMKAYVPITDQFMLNTCRMQRPYTWDHASFDHQKGHLHGGICIFLAKVLSVIHIHFDFFLFSRIRLVL